MVIEEVAFSVRHSVFSVLKTLVVRASQSNLELTYEVDSKIPDGILGDSLRLRQVLTNLIGNACKFTPSITKKGTTGRIDVSVRLQDIEDDSVTIEFCVADTGIGIPTEKLNVIFDMFSQADK
jgi:osomolarity two-component system, sensor histidine kinase NIK1